MTMQDAEDERDTAGDAPSLDRSDIPAMLFWGWIVGPLALWGGVTWVSGARGAGELLVAAIVSCSGFLLVLMPLTGFSLLRAGRRPRL
jgi:hypothetical protein